MKNTSLFALFLIGVLSTSSLCAQTDNDLLQQIDSSGVFAPMFPFQPTHRAPDNITNVRTWQGVNGSPAGTDGFIVSQGDSLVDQKGHGRRFIGTNIGMTGCFPTHEAADKLAKELTRYGINLVRLHYVSHRIPEQGYPEKDSFIEPVQLERFDYLFAKLKEQGIYIYFQLNIARKFGRVNGFENANLLPYYNNGVDNVDERFIELQKKFHKEILNHVNPYTGIAYKEDKAISMMELANENSIVYAWFSEKHHFPELVEPYKSRIIEKWNDWLIAKYANSANLKRAWNTTLVGVGKTQNLEQKTVDWPYVDDWLTPKQRAYDFTTFLSDVETRYFATLYSYLKDSLQVRQPVTGTQLGYGFALPQASTDYGDMHAYWCHPAFPGGKWDNSYWNLRNGSLTNSYGHAGSTLTKMARSRILGKPMTVSEYDHPNLNFYCAEADLMLAAMGSFQNWSALMQFAWILDTDYDREYVWPMFDMCSAPQKLVHFPACYAMFVRGDVARGDDQTVFVYPSSKAEDVKKVADGRDAASVTTFSSGLMNSLPLALVSGTRVTEVPNLFPTDGHVVISSDKEVPADIMEAYQNKMMQSSTGEITWNWQKDNAGFFMVDTRNTKVFSGFVANRFFVYKGMRLIPGKTRLDWLTLSLTLASPCGEASTDNGLRPGSYLLAATGLVHNTDEKIVTLPNLPDKISCTEPDGGQVGRAPVLCEGIDARLTFTGRMNRVRCYALDGDGNRMMELRVGANDAGEAVLDLRARYCTVWYELIVE